MKKFVVIFLVFLSSFLLVVPAFAVVDYDQAGLPSDWQSLYDEYGSTYPYATILKDNADAGTIYLYISKNPAVFYIDDSLLYFNNGFMVFKVYRGSWDLHGDYHNASTSCTINYNDGFTIVSLSYDLHNNYGNASSYGDKSFWVGQSSGGATDEPTEDEEYTGFLSGFFNGIIDWIVKVIDAIKNLPNTILEGIRGIFVPDADYLEERMDKFADDLAKKFSFDTSAFEQLFDSEVRLTDIEMDYNVPNIGDMHFTVFDADPLVDGVERMRPYIKGFLVLMLFLYHIKQLIGFFGYDAGVVTGRNEHIKNAKEQQ